MERFSVDTNYGEMPRKRTTRQKVYKDKASKLGQVGIEVGEGDVISNLPLYVEDEID